MASSADDAPMRFTEAYYSKPVIGKAKDLIDLIDECLDDEGVATCPDPAKAIVTLADILNTPEDHADLLRALKVEDFSKVTPDGFETLKPVIRLTENLYPEVEGIELEQNLVDIYQAVRDSLMYYLQETVDNFE